MHSSLTFAMHIGTSALARLAGKNSKELRWKSLRNGSWKAAGTLIPHTSRLRRPLLWMAKRKESTFFGKRQGIGDPNNVLNDVRGIRPRYRGGDLSECDTQITANFPGEHFPSFILSLVTKNWRSMNTIAIYRVGESCTLSI